MEEPAGAGCVAVVEEEEGEEEERRARIQSLSAFVARLQPLCSDS